MRVIAGSRRSLQLKTPEGMSTRPTQDRIKETLFNVIQNDVAGKDFLDLFSGSGGIGIEALSRGASHAVFVENARPAIACIKENIRYTDFEKEAAVMEMDAQLALERLRGHEEFGIIFMDPPYEAEVEPVIFRTLSKMDYVTPYTIIIVEAALGRDFSFLNEAGFEIYKIKQYKTNQHIFIRRK